MTKFRTHSKKAHAFRGAAVLIITALLALGLLLTGCPTPNTPTPPEYTAIAYGENGQGLKDYLNSLPEGETVHKIEVTGIPEAALGSSIGAASPFAKILRESGKKIALKLPADLPKIGGGALRGCPKLISADLSECTNITSIGANAFLDCTGLTEVKLPKELTKIASFAFSGCTNLKTLDLSGCTALTEIKQGAFRDCPIETLSINCDIKNTIITNLTQESSVKAAVKHLTIGEKVGSIEKIEAFGGYVIDSLTINRDVKETIITNLLYLNSITQHLKKLTLGAGCKMIGSTVFQGFEKLTEADFSACTDLAIHANAFVFCFDVTVKLPASVASIGNEAFGSEDNGDFCKNVLIPASNYEALKALVIGSGYPKSRIIRY